MCALLCEECGWYAGQRAVVCEALYSVRDRSHALTGTDITDITIPQRSIHLFLFFSVQLLRIPFLHSAPVLCTVLYPSLALLRHTIPSSPSPSSHCVFLSLLFPTLPPSPSTRTHTISSSLSPTQALPSSSRPYRDQKDSFDPPLVSSSNPDFLPGTLIPYDMYRRYRGLLEQKRELKRELKAYDEQFSRDYGRIPKKTDKEVRTCVRVCVLCSMFNASYGVGIIVVLSFI